MGKREKVKNDSFPQLMLTILLVGGWFIHIGAVENNLATKWLHWPLFFSAFVHHLWSLKIKNNCFREQLAIISELEPEPEAI